MLHYFDLSIYTIFSLKLPKNAHSDHDKNKNIKRDAITPALLQNFYLETYL